MFRLISLLGLVFTITATAHAKERRVALVIGNSAYQHAPMLANPRNDADGVSKRLVNLGFEVFAGYDLTFVGIRDTVRSFARQLEGADLALFFYAGHGLQVNGRNYIVPVDAKLEEEIDLAFEAFTVDFVLGAMERHANSSIVFLDACRDNPLARNLARAMGTRGGSVGRGLARIEAGVGTLISYATQPGNVALDGTGQNSPFTTALLAHLGTPGEDIGLTLRKVRTDVLAATNGNQVPWENSSLTDEVILKALGALKVSVDEVGERMRENRDADVEITFWNSIKDSGQQKVFEAYLNQFPEGRFASLARLQIEALEDGAPAAAEPDRETALVAPEDPKLARARRAEEALGLTRADYREIQRKLNISGIEVGVEDGLFGPRSRRGLKTFQQVKQLNVTGYLTTETVRQLEAAVASVSRSTEVRQREERLGPGGKKSSEISRLQVTFDGLWTGEVVCERVDGDPPDVDLTRPRARYVHIAKGVGYYRSDARSREDTRKARQNYTEIKFEIDAAGGVEARGFQDCCFHNGELLADAQNLIALSGAVGPGGVMRLKGINGPRRCEWMLSR